MPSSAASKRGTMAMRWATARAYRITSHKALCDKQIRDDAKAAARIGDDQAGAVLYWAAVAISQSLD